MSTNLNLVSRIRNGGDPKEITAQIEGVLYLKAQTLVEQTKLVEARDLLSEADPKPKVEQDHRGNPIVPSASDFARYFNAMQAGHIAAQLKATQERWAEVQKHVQTAVAAANTEKGSKAKATAAKHAEAELKALRAEIQAATTALAKKRAVKAKKRKATGAQVNKAIEKTVHGLTGGSKLATHIASAIGRRVFKTED
jgi:membrane protein involved in colicin uptake